MSTTTQALQADGPTPTPTFDPHKLTRLLADPSKPLAARLATIRWHIISYAQVPGQLRWNLAAGNEREVVSIIEKYDQLDRVHLLPLDVGNALAAGRTGPVVAQVDGIDPIHAATAAQSLIKLERAVMAELRLRAVAHHFDTTGEIIEEPTAGHLIAAVAELEPLLVACAREAERLRAEAEVEFARAVANAAAVPTTNATNGAKRTSRRPIAKGTQKRAPHRLAQAKEELCRFLVEHVPKGEGWAFLRDLYNPASSRAPSGYRTTLGRLLEAAEIKLPPPAGEEAQKTYWRNIDARLRVYRESVGAA
jgi:hypothetical protein